jgi:hypothetical protein
MQIAAALQAEKLILMTDVPGVLRTRMMCPHALTLLLLPLLHSLACVEIPACSATVVGAPSRHASTALCCMISLIWRPAILYIVLCCMQIAAALQAEKLILMTDAPGVLKDKVNVSTCVDAAAAAAAAAVFLGLYHADCCSAAGRAAHPDD